MPSTAAALLIDPMSLAGMRLSPAEQRLYGPDDAPIALERKAFDLLCYLVAHRERVVGKDELLQHVWGRSIASDTVVAQAISKARKALASGGGESEWIDVVRAVGYRYVGPAEVSLPIATSSAIGAVVAKRAPVSPTRRWRAAVCLLAMLGLGLLLGGWWQREAMLRDPLRIAVLPWRDDSGDPALQWSSLGLQALIVDALASDRRLAPASQADVRSLLGARPDLADPLAQADYLRAAIGVDHVYAGRLARSDEGMAIELMVLGPDAVSTRLSGVEVANLALAASSDLTQRLLPGFDPARPLPLSAVAFANEAYARGVDSRLRGHAEEAVHHLGSALAADPHLLPARFQLSVAQQLRRDNPAWKQALDQLLVQAQSRDDRLHQGLALGGLGVLAWREGRLGEAEQLIARSSRYFDGPADALRRAGAAGNLGSIAAMQGDFDEAERQLLLALHAFEAAGRLVEVARVSKNLGVMNIDRGRFEQARTLFERSRDLRQSLGLERDLAETLVSLGAADLSLEAPSAAEATLARAVDIFVRYRDPLLESDALARLALAQIAQGRLRAAADSAGRSLAAARSVDNAAARGLAHLRLALIARLREDGVSAEAELARAEIEMQQANDGRGLARIALERIALAQQQGLTDEQRAQQRDALDALLAQMRERGWRVLEAEVLALRAESSMDEEADSARAQMLAAFAMAVEISEPALLTDLACRVAKFPPSGAAQDEEGDAWRRASKRCFDAAARDARAAGLRAQRARAAGDAAEAQRWWLQRKQLLGEAWTNREQAELEAWQRVEGLDGSVSSTNLSDEAAS